MFHTLTSSIHDFLIHVAHLLDYLFGSSLALNLLQQHNYSSDRLASGRILLQEAQTMFDTMLDLQRKQKAATDAFNAELQQAQRFYQVHIQAARRILPRDAERLLTRVPAAYTRWLAHARNFYTAMLQNPSYQEKLRQVSIPAEELVRINQMIDGVIARKHEQTQAQEQARIANRERQGKHDALIAWYMEFMATARFAFRTQPAILQAMGTFEIHKKVTRSSAKKVQPTVIL